MSLTGPPAGLKVLEMGQLITGPLAARMLADFGADAIKIEPPGTGDPLRKWRCSRIPGRRPLCASWLPNRTC